ncbi:putative membrane protein [Candidatus Protofrankia californiensis]|uniref:Putative membrane protein n=1 Tax=Candidatus Protofrankia californiensis TaxID=1839754 RepID=A0A1C3PB85_9ACTN|nr:putative membrane protein [Candidatus Protofrankia californiensis]
MAVATAAGVAVMMGLAALLGSAVDLDSTKDNGSSVKIIKCVLVGLLAAAAVKNWVGRETAEPPAWLRTLMTGSATESTRPRCATSPEVSTSTTA